LQFSQSEKYLKHRRKQSEFLKDNEYIKAVFSVEILHPRSLLDEISAVADSLDL
jgi:hypothetical protein